MSESRIYITSILGMNTGAAMVEMVLPGQEKLCLTAKDARKLAIDLLQCADASQSDRSIFNMLTEGAGLTVEDAAKFIAELRERRKNDWQTLEEAS